MLILKLYFKLLAEKWWLWLLLELLLLGGAVFYTIRQPLRYTSSTVVALNPTVVNPLVPYLNEASLPKSAEKLAANYSVALKTDRFAVALAGLLDFPTDPTALKGNYRGDLVPDTVFYLISGSADTPAHAKEVADRATALFLAQDAQLQTSTGDPTDLTQAEQTEVAGLRADIKTIQQEVEALLAQPERDWTKINTLLDKFNLKNRLLLTLLHPARFNTTLASQLTLPPKEDQPSTLAATDRSGMLIDPAKVAKYPDADNFWRNIIIAAAIGLALYNALMLGWYVFKPTVRSVEQLEALLHFDTLAVVPVFDSRARGRLASQALIVRDDGTGSVAGEIYRTLRTNLLFVEAGSLSLHTLLVTSTNAGEGKTTTAVNLANALALAGKRVILIDADLRKPSLHTIYGLPNVPGLTELLGDPTSLDRALQPTATAGLLVIASGTLPPNPAELLGRASMSGLLKELESQADLVIIDTPPASFATDAALLARQVDGVLFVVSYNRANQRTILKTTTEMSRLGGRIVGTVFNRAGHPRLSSSYYYGYGQKPTKSSSKK